MSKLLTLIVALLAGLVALPHGDVIATSGHQNAGARYGVFSTPVWSGDIHVRDHAGNDLVLLGDESLWMLFDHLGSVRAELGGNSSITTQEYDPYGAALVEGWARYTGHPRDPRTSLYRTPSRAYDAATGRFLSPDSERQGPSPYPYAAGNPVGYLDVTGNAPRPFIIKSGILRSDSTNDVVLALARALGLPEDARFQDATAFFGKPDQPEAGRTSQARKNTRSFLYGSKNPQERIPLYDDRLYWIIDDEIGSPKVPGDIQGGLERARIPERQPDFARRIVLIDVSGLGMAHVPIARELDRIPGARYELIRAQIQTTFTQKHDAFRVRTKKTATGMLRGGKQYSLSEFNEYVQIIAGMVDNAPDYVPTGDRPRPSERRTTTTTPGGDLGPDGQGGAGPPPPEPEEIMSGMWGILNRADMADRELDPEFMSDVFGGFGEK